MRISKSKGFKKVKKMKEKKKEMPIPKKRKVIEGITGIVRVAEKDLPGELKVRHAILRVKGVGQTLAKAIPIAAEIDSEAMIGGLSDEQLKKLEDCVKNPEKYGIPTYMINRRFDPVTGENKHIVSSGLTLTIKGDVDRLRKIRAYRGIRHELGLPVRGQRTKSSFRKGAIVGVARKRIREAQKGKKKK